MTDNSQSPQTWATSQRVNQGKKMGHWFSTHQENNNTASSSAISRLEETELSYHAPTLHWTGGILLAAAVCAALYYYFKKYKKMAIVNMVASIHQS